jgi:hypothetical protein
MCGKIMLDKKKKNNNNKEKRRGVRKKRRRCCPMIRQPLPKSPPEKDYVDSIRYRRSYYYYHGE